MGDEIEPECRRIARAGREVVVAPAAGRQAFEFQVAIGRKALRPLLMDMAAIVEDAQAREFGIERRAHFRAELLVDPFVLGQPIGMDFGIKIHRVHGLQALFTDAIGREDNVEKDARRRIGTGDFVRHFQEFVAIRLVVEAERVPAGLQLARVEPIVRRRAHPPLRMQPRIALVPLHGDVDGAFDIGGVERIDHFTEEVGPRQVRMRRAGFGRVIGPAVVALGKNGNAIDMRLLQRRDEICRVKILADIRDMLGRMKIQMNLAITHRLVGTGFGHSLAPVRVCDPAAN